MIWHQLVVTSSVPQASLTKVGYKVTRETGGIVEHIEDRPGMLGNVTRRLADAGIKLTTMYLATDTRLVLGCENISALETAWEELAAVASRKAPLYGTGRPSGRPVPHAVRAPHERSHHDDGQH